MNRAKPVIHAAVIYARIGGSVAKKPAAAAWPHTTLTHMSHACTKNRVSFSPEQISFEGNLNSEAVFLKEFNYWRFKSKTGSFMSQKMSAAGEKFR